MLRLGDEVDEVDEVVDWGEPGRIEADVVVDVDVRIDEVEVRRTILVVVIYCE